MCIFLLNSEESPEQIKPAIVRFLHWRLIHYDQVESKKDKRKKERWWAFSGTELERRMQMNKRYLLSDIKF